MNEFNYPPLNRRSAEEVRRERDVSSAVIDVIGAMLLSNPNAPESRKIGIRIMLEAKQLTDKITKSFLLFAEPEMDSERCEALYPERKEVLEYLQLVHAGIDAFLQTHPISKENQ